VDAATTETRRGHRIATRVLLLVGLGVVGPLIAMIWASWGARAQLDREKRLDEEMIASLIAARVDAALSAELEALQSAAIGARSLREVRARPHALIDQVALIDARGAVLEQEPAGPAIDGPAIVAEALRAGRPSFTRTHALVPARSWRGELSRIAAGSVDASRLGLLVREGSIPRGLAIDIKDASGQTIASGGSPTGRTDRVVSAPLPSAGWSIAVSETAAETFPETALLGLALPLLGIGLLFGWGAARSLTRPLAALTFAAERLTAGDLATPMPEVAADEVGRLGTALERMRLALKESQDKLEHRVALRTAEVRHLLGKVITAQEHERRRVARELHDDTSQGLAALLLKLRSRPGLADETALALGTLDAIHRLIADLRPSVLDDLGLTSAIAWCADRHLRSRGVNVRCEFSGLDQRLPPEHETAVFRVVQEGIANIDRHARAETVLIQGVIRDHELSIEVEDDGDGFEEAAFATPDRAGRGWGLLGMRERVEMLGGRLVIHSSPGKGTHLELHVPLPEGAPWTASAS
jgi:signal transduction histidine kinase